MLAFIFSNLPFSCFSLRFYHKSFQHQNTNSRAEPKAAISFSFSRAGPWGLYSVSVLGSSYQKQTGPAQCSPPSDPQECPEQQHFCPLRAQKAGTVRAIRPFSESKSVLARRTCQGSLERFPEKNNQIFFAESRDYFSALRAFLVTTH